MLVQPISSNLLSLYFCFKCHTKLHGSTVDYFSNFIIYCAQKWTSRRSRVTLSTLHVKITLKFNYHMPKGRKRNLSSSQASGSKPKRLRKASPSLAPDPEDVIVIDSDKEINESDDLNTILAQIKAQEDDEAMAKRLAAEWAEAESTNLEEGVDDFPMDLSDIEQVFPGTPNDASASTSSVSKGKGSLSKTRMGIMDFSDSQGNKSYISVPITPDEGLTPFRDMFTKTRPCSKCGKDVQSSRGSVSDSMRFTIYVSLTQGFRDSY